jgi:hypothetical protein
MTDQKAIFESVSQFSAHEPRPIDRKNSFRSPACGFNMLLNIMPTIKVERTAGIYMIALCKFNPLIFLVSSTANANPMTLLQIVVKTVKSSVLPK